MIKRAEELAVGDVLPDGRMVAAPPVVEGLSVRVPATWHGEPALDRIYRLGSEHVVNIPSS